MTTSGTLIVGSSFNLLYLIEGCSYFKPSNIYFYVNFSLILNLLLNPCSDITVMNIQSYLMEQLYSKLYSFL